jgi:hypothetical protein
MQAEIHRVWSEHSTEVRYLYVAALAMIYYPLTMQPFLRTSLCSLAYLRSLAYLCSLALTIALST